MKGQLIAQLYHFLKCVVYYPLYADVVFTFTFTFRSFSRRSYPERLTYAGYCHTGSLNLLTHLTHNSHCSPDTNRVFVCVRERYFNPLHVKLLEPFMFCHALFPAP
jgi:hypothetical protein